VLKTTHVESQSTGTASGTQTDDHTGNEPLARVVDGRISKVRADSAAAARAKQRHGGLCRLTYGVSPERELLPDACG
jgi:hypothetical protein